MEATIGRGVIRWVLAGSVAGLLAGCLSAGDIRGMQEAWETSRNPQLACHAAPADEIHPPGDRGWIGHDMTQLREVLGAEVLDLGWPSDNRVLVYDQVASAGCFDAYVIGPCNTVIDYHCR
ncbi:MAG TPA: hypothetical protein VIX81_11965 [Gammaproteobacteria bacterium]